MFRTERAQQSALMVKPRRLSDSSVGSACSDNEGGFTANNTAALPHVRSQTDRNERENAPADGYRNPAIAAVVARGNHNSGGSLRITSNSNSANSGIYFLFEFSLKKLYANFDALYRLDDIVVQIFERETPKSSLFRSNLNNF